MSARLRHAALALLPALIACGAESEPRDAPRTPHPRARSVVVFTVDTLRADALATYGGTTSTPHLDALAAESLIFESAYTQACRTNPALTSLLTGLAPPHTAVFLQHHRMAPSARSLATLARAGGISTGSFVANLCELQEQERTVWSEGWDTSFCGMDRESDQHLWDRAVVDAATEWIAAQNGPYFCWVHLMDPHAEHRPAPEDWDYFARPLETAPEQWQRLGQYELATAYPPKPEIDELRELYAAEVRGIDRELGRFTAFLDARPDAAETALVFSADHGEELYETWPKHGHGLSLTEGVLRVPLFLRAPDVAPERRAHNVETLQITPTVLGLFGLEPPYALDGPSLLDPEYSKGLAVSYSGEIVSARRGNQRLWHHSRELPSYNRHIADELEVYRSAAPWLDQPLLLAEYDAERPNEPRWIYPAQPEASERALALRKRLEAYLRRFESLPEPEEIHDAGLDAQLEGLGYTGAGDH